MKKLSQYKTLILNILFFAISIVLLIYPALLNGYPLVYSDSGAYIASGFDGHVPVDRPIMYAFFVRHISMASSLWFVIVMQAILVIVSILVSIKYFLKIEKHFFIAFISIAFLSITTGISYYVSQIMPDIFSPVAIISLGLLICFQDLNKYLKITFSILLVFSNMAHSSNLITTTTILLSLIFSSLLFKKYFKQSIKNIFFVSSLVFFSWIITPSMNYLLDAGFKVSRAPNVFIMGRFAESGVLNQYLHEKCPGSIIKFCSYMDHLPATSGDFLWDINSPLYDAGFINREIHKADCWLLKNDEYKPIVKEIFTTPRFLKTYIGFAANQSWKQLYSFEIEDLKPMMEGSPVLGNIFWRYKREYNQYYFAEQAKHPLTYPVLSKIQDVIIISSLFLFFLFISISRIRKKIPQTLKVFSLLGFIGLISNAITCASLSMIAGRFQGRVIWLIPFFLLMMCFSYVIKKNPAKSDN